MRRIGDLNIRSVSAAASLILLVVAGQGVAQSQKTPGAPVDETAFTSGNWVQTYPDYSYLDGCTTGERAFTFQSDHYFIFNFKVHGSWRLSSSGNTINLLIRSGPTPSVLQLVYDGSSTLRPNLPTNLPTTVQSNPANGTFSFRRSDLFTRCATTK